MKWAVAKTDGGENQWARNNTKLEPSKVEYYVIRQHDQIVL